MHTRLAHVIYGLDPLPSFALAVVTGEQQDREVDPSHYSHALQMEDQITIQDWTLFCELLARDLSILEVWHLT